MAMSTLAPDAVTQDVSHPFATVAVPATEGLRLSSVLLSLRELGGPYAVALETYFVQKPQALDQKGALTVLIQGHPLEVSRAVQRLFRGGEGILLQTRAVCEVDVSDVTRRSPELSEFDSTKHDDIARTNNTQRKQMEAFTRHRSQAVRNLQVRHIEGVLDVAHRSAKTFLQRFIVSLAQMSTQRQEVVNITGSRRLNSPKGAVRESNSKLEDVHNARAEEERQAILAGVTFSKRGRTTEDEDSHFREKLTKALQEEEDRVRTSATNEAVRSALGGDVKYLRWSQVVQEAPNKIQERPRSPEIRQHKKSEAPTTIPIAEQAVRKSVSLIDLFAVVSDDSLAYARTRSQQFRTQMKLYS